MKDVQRFIELTMSRDALVISPADWIIRIPVKDAVQERKKSALIKAVGFFASNSDEIMRVFSENGEVEMNLLGIPDYQQMVNALRYARVSKSMIRHDISQLIENSPHSPDRNGERVIADKFVNTVYSDAKRFALEAQCKKSATLST